MKPYKNSFWKCPDQNLLNLYIKSEQLLPLNCTWNFIPRYFYQRTTAGKHRQKSKQPCPANEISILHGLAGEFFKKAATFTGRMLFKYYEDAKLDSSFNLVEFVKN